MAAACEALAALQHGALVEHESALLQRLQRGLADLGIEPHRIWSDSEDAVGIASFAVPGIPAAKVATVLSAEHGVGLRDGRFCAHPLLARIGSPSSVRASLGVGSTNEHVDRLISGLEELVTAGPRWSYGRDPTAGSLNLIPASCRPGPIASS